MSSQGVRVCPKCHANEPTRVKRRLLDRVLMRSRVYYCDACQRRFSERGKAHAAHEIRPS